MLDQQKTILMLCYKFPPIIGSSFRHVNFVRNLPQFGWKPIVVSVKSIHSKWNKGDDLYNELKKSTLIYRTGSIDPYRLFYIVEKAFNKLFAKNSNIKSNCVSNKRSSGLKFWDRVRPWTYVPDLNIGWVPFAVNACLKIISKFKVDIIFSSGLPLSSHLAALILKQITHKPWIADFPDSWYFNPLRNPVSALHNKLDDRLERSVIYNADLVLLSYGKKIFEKRYKSESKEKFVQVFHGYDENDFIDLKQIKTEKFTIIYTGALYGEQSAYSFIKAINMLLESRPQIRRKLLIHFIGTQDVKTISLINKLRLGNICKISEPVSHKESVKYMMGADLLLLFLKDFSESNNFIIPSKIFIYLRAFKRILAIIPNGDTKELLRQHIQVVFAFPNDKKGISQIISKEFDNYSSNRQFDYSSYLHEIKKYDSRIIAEKLSKIMTENYSIWNK